MLPSTRVSIDMPIRPSTKLESLQSTFRALVDIGEQVMARSQYKGRGGFLDPAQCQAWRELGAGCTRLASLQQLMRDYLTSWNECVGADVEEFWRLTEDRGLSVERKQDVVAETLARGRILTVLQFQEIEDHFEELQECGKISSEQASELSRMLDTFEANPKNWARTSSR